jgi:hypothetical protein
MRLRSRSRRRGTLGHLFDAESFQFWLFKSAQYLIDRLANVSNKLALTV